MLRQARCSARATSEPGNRSRSSKCVLKDTTAAAAADDDDDDDGNGGWREMKTESSGLNVLPRVQPDRRTDCAVTQGPVNVNKQQGDVSATEVMIFFTSLILFNILSFLLLGGKIVKLS